MQLYIGHSTNINFEDDLYAPLRDSKLAEEHALVFPHEESDSLFDSRRFLREDCDVFIAEVSTASTGLGIELGWADQFGVPIVCVYKSGATPSSSLQAVTDVLNEYDTAHELVDVIENELG